MERFVNSGTLDAPRDLLTWRSARNAERAGGRGLPRPGLQAVRVEGTLLCDGGFARLQAPAGRGGDLSVVRRG